MTGVSEGVRCMKIGFIGLGRMGSAMAANLVKAGHQLTVFNRSPDKRRKLVELGAHEAARIADACRGEAVITMLADDAALSSVTLADGGIVASLPKGAIHVSMSTVSVALARELTKAHAAAGQRFIAAPVFGRPEAAAAAKLFIVAAGEPAAVETCLPLFFRAGTEDAPDQPGACSGESRQAQRKFPAGVRDRGAGRGHRAREQGGRRPPRLRRAAHGHDFPRSSLRDLWRPDRGKPVRAGGFHGGTRTQGYPPGARRGGKPARADAA